MLLSRPSEVFSRTEDFIKKIIVAKKLLLLSAILFGSIVNIVAQNITSFTLIDAENDVEIGLIQDGTSYVLADLPSNQLNMNANTSGNIGSVVFKINGVKTQTENESPYALAGNIGANYLSWKPNLETYTITATTYSQAKGQGQVLDEESITITFTEAEEEEEETVPQVPSNLKGIALGSDRIELTWQDQSDNEADFVLEYRPFDSTNEPWVVLAVLPANTSSYSDTRSDNNFERHYRLKAVNAIGSSAYTESISVVNFPLPPSNLVVSNVTTKSFKLTWDAAPYGNDYLIERSTQVDGPYEFYDALYFGYTSFDYANLTPNTTYYFRMLTNLNGMPSEWSETFSVSTLPEDDPEEPQGPKVTSFVLVNADTDQDIAQINEGDVFNLAEIGTSNLNVRAEVGGGTESVVFDYNGQSNFQTENLPVYAIGGNTGSDYRAWNPDLGSNTITAKAYNQDNGQGVAGEPLTVNFTFINEVEEEPEGPKVTSFVLVNADSDQDISEIMEGDVYNLAEIGTSNLNVRAEVEGGTESVIFDYNGQSNFQTDNSPVYAIGGNTGDDYNAWNPNLGSNTISAKAYTQANGQGVGGDALTVNFSFVDEVEVEEPKVTSLVLINADSDQDITVIKEGDVFNLAEIGTSNLNIRAEVEGGTESVVFGYNEESNYQTDNSPVYAIGGNIGNDYGAWNADLGSNTITATAYTQDNGQGVASDPFTLNFTVTNEVEPEEPQGPRVTSFVLINADSDQDIAQINEGDVFNLTEIGTSNLNVRAEVEGGTESVIFDYNGQTNFQTENLPVYALAGNSGNDYDSWNPDLGSNTITATAYTQDNGQGVAGDPLTVNFSFTNEVEPEEPKVTALVLINADNDQDIAEIKEGDVFNLAEIGTSNLNVRAEVEGGTESVIFDYNGQPNFQTDNSSAYALGGNTGNDYGIWNPDLGSNTISATAYTQDDGQGVASVPITVNFTVVNEAEPEEPQVTSLILVNADSDQDIAVIKEGDVFNLAEIGTSKLNVRAEVEGGTESVVFDYNNQNNFQIDNTPVYALGGNNGNDYDAWVPNLGSNTIKATAYTQDNGQGTASNPLSINFSFINVAEPDESQGPKVNSFVLINADSDQDIAVINEGDVFNLAEIGTSNLNVRAEVDAETESVIFDYNGQTNFQTENLPVYALGGNSGNDYDAWNPDLGSNTITATAYTQDKGQGIAGEPSTVNFTFINEVEPEEPEDLPAVVRINAGGGMVSYGDTTFIADSYFAGNGKPYENQNISNILNTNQDEIYKTERSTNAALQSFSYDIPVTNGEYQVDLHFAEIYYGATAGGSGGSGKRIFSVSIEGQEVLTDYDINALVGPMTAIIERFNTTVSDEELNITFTGTVDQPKLSALSIYGEGSLISDPEPEDCAWTDLANSSLSKVEAQSAKVNGKLYVLAGFLSGLKITGETEIYDPATDQWSTGTPMPTPVTHMGAVVVDDEIWIVAGFAGNHPGVATDKVQIYNTISNEWSEGPSLPNPRGSGAAVYNDGKIHFFGGLLPDRVTDVGEHYILDVSNQSAGWLAAAPLPNPRNHLSGAAVNGLVYALGGQYGHDNGVQDQDFVDAYDPNTDTWTRLAGLPSARSHFEPGTMVHNDKIIIVGGRRGGFFFSDVTEYDPSTNEWTERCPLPSKLLAPAAKTFGDRLIVANGGEDGTCCPKSATLSIPIEPEVIEPEVDTEGVVSGELRKWHKVTVSFEGPDFSETGTENPFRDYRLNVTFKNGSSTYTVPGYYAADGNAANTSANSGKIWKVHFSPDKTGTWTYEASFRKGNDIAISTSANAGSAVSFNGASGSFEVLNSNKGGRDFRGKGRLEYVGEHYLQFAESGEYFIKAGSDAPENTFAYEDFDATPNKGGRRKSWQPHSVDFSLGDAGNYTWGNTQGDGARANGRELLGALGYLSNQGMNVFSFLTFSLNGDDGNVYPHAQKTANATDWSNVHHDRFDVSKLEQWEKILEYADKKGIYIHFKTQETENDLRMDGGQLGIERKLYYRELIARFGHHLALNWNLGEENDIWSEIGDPNQNIIKSYAQYIKNVDPYDHHIVIHTYPGQQDEVYNPLLGNNSVLTGPSVQSGINNVHRDVRKWVQDSESAGKKWVVANDEQGGANIGVGVDASYPDNLLPENRNEGDNRKDVRSKVLWGTLMAGGAGVEYYYGYQTGCDDLDCQDHRTRESKWKDAKIALGFFNDYLQPKLTDMKSSDDLTSNSGDYVFAKENDTYVIYLPSGGSTNINLGSSNNYYTIQWFDPRSGGALQTGSTTGVAASSSASIGNPPSSTNQDWVALLTKTSAPNDALKVLVYHETNGFRHGSINAGITMIEEFGVELGWEVTNSQSSSVFTESGFNDYDVVVFLNTSGNALLNAQEKAALETFISNNKGFVGVHAATDTYRDKSWPWYNDLVGAIVQTSPNHTPNNTSGVMDVLTSHPTVDHLGTTWSKMEEYYYWELNGGQLYEGNINLLEVRSTGSNSYDATRPITWYKNFGGGRSFYTALGHNSSDYTNNEEFITMMREAIIWAADGVNVANNQLVSSRSIVEEFKLYPNPALDFVNIETEVLENEGTYDLHLFSMDGTLVKAQQIPSGLSSIEISDLSPGNYFVLIKGVNFIQQKKLIVIR